MVGKSLVNHIWIFYNLIFRSWVDCFKLKVDCEIEKLKLLWFRYFKINILGAKNQKSNVLCYTYVYIERIWPRSNKWLISKISLFGCWWCFVTLIITLLLSTTTMAPPMMKLTLLLFGRWCRCLHCLCPAPL